MSSIFKNEIYLDPKYAKYEKYVNIMFKGQWTPAKYQKLIKDQDVPYYFNQMDNVSREAIRRCILAVATVEDKVKSFWSLISIDLPQTVISDVSGVFSNSEVVHRISYHSLVSDLKIDLNEINDHKALEGRIKYLSKHLEKDPQVTGKKFTLKKLVLFTALVERVSLFTQFYILMSFSFRRKQINTISALQQTTAKEEIIHYSCGVDLINDIKNDEPKLWDDYLQELVKKNLLDAHEAETNLISWFFEKGVPSHLTIEEVLNFLNANFNQVAQDIGVDLVFDFDEELYEKSNKWFMVEILNTIEPDFFDNAVGGYSSEEVLIDVDNFEF